MHELGTCHVEFLPLEAALLIFPFQPIIVPAHLAASPIVVHAIVVKLLMIADTPDLDEQAPVSGLLVSPNTENLGNG